MLNCWENLYIRFTCSMGDAIGMNMVSKGVQNVLDSLPVDFPDMDVIGISRNFCSDKKLVVVNWIEGRETIAGSLGGFNAHVANIVSVVFIAMGQEPAQNIESSHCITMMEVVNGGKDLHISVIMPSIEVGTVGSGTQLASQSACLVKLLKVSIKKIWAQLVVVLERLADMAMALFE
ncbi:hypothetical protein L6452_15420 [Arctium lappa]|uniref:Uncharacterized protein n=1 Tax=Arctium lappa TaxID=4217 RepID=A0ACB9CPA4_ARCLA|nr:hypothetical protein L6452_15420 [Arctium lappa]